MLVIKVYMEYMRENGMHMSLEACALNIWEAQIRKKNYRQKKENAKKRVTCMNDGGSYLNDFYLHEQ